MTRARVGRARSTRSVAGSNIMTSERRLEIIRQAMSEMKDGEHSTAEIADAVGVALDKAESEEQTDQLTVAVTSHIKPGSAKMSMLPLIAQKVEEEIRAERARQDSQWGGKAHDYGHDND